MRYVPTNNETNFSPPSTCFRLCRIMEQRVRRRSRTVYSARYKLRVVSEALARPPSCRIKPTCRNHPGIEPVMRRRPRHCRHAQGWQLGLCRAGSPRAIPRPTADPAAQVDQEAQEHRDVRGHGGTASAAQPQAREGGSSPCTPATPPPPPRAPLLPGSYEECELEAFRSDPLGTAPLFALQAGSEACRRTLRPSEEGWGSCISIVRVRRRRSSCSERVHRSRRRRSATSPPPTHGERPTPCLWAMGTQRSQLAAVGR